MRKAVLTTARVLFATGATGMLGIAMLTAPTAAWASSGGCSSTAPCSLAFTPGGQQPTGTTVGSTITSSFDSANVGPSNAAPVQVAVVDQSGNTVTNATVSITIAITSTANPGGGTLSGTKTVKTRNGVASFSDLSIDQPGVGYRLTATSKGLGFVTSGHFDIWSSIQQCSTTPCSASASSATTSGTVTTTSATGSPQFVAAGIGGVNNYSCAGTYQPVSDPFSFDVVSGSGGTGQGGQFTAVLRIDKATVQSSNHPGASTWQLCYASTSSFPGSSSVPTTIGDVSYFTGLLPDCSNTTPVPPCVQARNKDNAGDVLVTFLASGDPLGKG